jgi:hypothetical protein
VDDFLQQANKSLYTVGINGHAIHSTNISRTSSYQLIITTDCTYQLIITTDCSGVNCPMAAVRGKHAEAKLTSLSL